MWGRQRLIDVAGSLPEQVKRKRSLCEVARRAPRIVDVDPKAVPWIDRYTLAPRQHRQVG